MEQFYLEFTEFDDKYYSTDEDGENDEFSVLSSAGKALIGKKGKYLKYTTEGPDSYRKKNAFGKLSDRYKLHRQEDAKKKFRSVKKEKAKMMAEKDKKDPVKMIQKDKNNPFKKMPNSGKAKVAAGTAVGGAAGVGIGHLASKKWRQELATLKLKQKPSEADLKKIQSLKRKITAAKVGGGLIGAGAGFAGTKKYIKK